MRRSIRFPLAASVALGAAALLGSRDSQAQPKPADRLPVAFSPDGKLVAAGVKDGHVKIWDAATLKPVRALIRHSIKVCVLAFTPDSSLLLAGCEDGSAQVYMLSKGEIIAEAGVPNEVEPVTAIAVSSDGKRFVLASQNRAVHMFEIMISEDRKGEKHGQCKLLRTFRRPAGAMAAVTFSPADKGVLAGGAEHVLVLWDAETKAEQGAVEGHKDLITAICTPTTASASSRRASTGPSSSGRRARASRRGRSTRTKAASWRPCSPTTEKRSSPAGATAG